MTTPTATEGASRSRATAVAVALKQRYHRLIHPGRHRRLERRLRKGPARNRIVVVCYGNMCRSPFFAAMLQRLRPDIDVSSAGFVGAGRRVPGDGLAVALDRGIDLSTHRSRLISRELLVGADLVVVMDPAQAVYLIKALRYPSDRIVVAADLDSAAGDGRVIHDPWRQSRDVFVSSFGRLERCANALAKILP